ncbi:MAG TPA: FxDxF family PEP-CTERM protein [Caulobacteraceae bacterium]|nr:FxDxF family PEP-CTERM protein [Caulobacteraceae bacterium]
MNAAIRIAKTLGIAAAIATTAVGAASARTVFLGNLNSGQALTIPTLVLTQGKNYNFTFDLLPTSTVLSQLQASLLTKSGSTAEPIQFALYSGTPGGTHTLIDTSAFVVGPTLTDNLTPGNYYIKITDIAVNHEQSSGAVTATTVPEPASWAMLIAGFGLAGYALRRRRTVLASA